MTTEITDRHLKIIRLRQNNPCMMGAEIAGIVGISRERVRQVLAIHGLRNSAVDWGRRQLYICNQCGQEFKASYKNPLYCSWKCYKRAHQVEVACSICGNMFTLTQSDLIDRMRNRKDDGFYCSKKCYGVHLVREHRFIAHPENITGKVRYL